METSANIPTKCFSVNPVDDFTLSLEEQCNFQESTEKWLELEQFWDDPRHRLQEFDNQNQLSSSLERHLLYDDCLQEPSDEVFGKISKQCVCVDSEVIVVAPPVTIQNVG